MTAVNIEAIERLEQQMREMRAARSSGANAQGDQVFRNTPETRNPRSAPFSMVFTFTGKLGSRRDAEVRVIPEESISVGPHHCLARLLRFEQMIPGCIQRVKVAFEKPVRVDKDGLTIEVEGRDAKGRRRLHKMFLDPLLPFRGDDKSRRQFESFGAKYIK